MKRTFILLLILLCFILPSLSYASIDNLKANIYLKPEDLHPNGVNMEIGTASFWFEVGASISGDSGESISYQWYESKTGNMDDIVAIKNENREIFIPDQKIGTTYYCVGVTTKLGDESTVEYTKLLEATFTPKIIDKIWITGISEPNIGSKSSASANQYTDYELNNYYGYEITSVSWIPNDKNFKENVEYRVDVGIELWDNVELADKVDVKINDMVANFTYNEGNNNAIVSYTFDKLSMQKEESGEQGEEQISGDNNFENIVDEKSNNEEKLDISAIILCTVCITVLIFGLMIGIRKK